MLLLVILAVMLALGVIGVVTTIASRDRNTGLIGGIIMVMVEVICCIVLYLAKTPNVIINTLSIYYISSSWILFFVMLLVQRLDVKRKVPFFLSPGVYLSIINTALMIYNMFTGKMFGGQKHIMMGSNWWVIKVKSEQLYLVYKVVIVVSAVYIAALLIKEIVKAASFFRLRSIVMLLSIGFAMAVRISADINSWPVWISTISTFIVCINMWYLTLYFASNKLTKTSLMLFANELSEGFILYDERGRLTYVNDLLSKYLTDEQLKAFEHISAFEEWSKDVVEIEGINVKKLETTVRTRYLRVHRHLVGGDDKYIGTFFNLEDMTDSIIQFEAMEKINEELEQTARMKSDFLANMSHEIRTPMNAVIGMAEMALREELPSQATSYINQIKTSGHNLLNIINDILDFSKIESGKMDIIPDVYEPVSEYQDVANTLMTRVGDKDIELVVNVDPAIPYKLDGDAMRIRQVLINIANNAIKFTKEGQVSINVTFQKLSEDTINTIVHVVDTGMGIKEEDLKKLFVSFQQVDAKRNRSIEGTGLGLAISKSLVEAMGGKIGVSSEYGVGSDFYFEIPQKIVDDTPSMKVERQDSIIVLGAFSKENLQREFVHNMKSFNVVHRLVDIEKDVEASYEEYRKDFEDAHCFFMFDLKLYNDVMKKFLETHLEVEGVILVDFDSLFTSEQPNLRVIRRPFTTLSLSLVLNNKSMVVENRSDAFSFDFVAPDAKVLIVDDNSINLTVASGLLDPLEMTVYTASSGKEAIRHIESTSFDLIFMDHMMPEMDGVETTKYIRSNIAQAKDIPIIALTANAISGAKEMFLSCGMNDFVSKPIELKAIVSKVKQWLPQEKVVKNKSVVSNQEEEKVEIPGLDCESAISLVGSPKLYKKIALDYYKNIDSNYNDIMKCYTEEDYKNYTIKVHALKSSSKQIGAKDLAVMAEKLEKAGHESDIDYIKNNTMQMFEAYRGVQEILKPYFGADDAQKESLKELDSAFLTEQLEKLKAGCDDLDMDVLEEVSEAISSFSYTDEQRAVVDAIIQAISYMDVDTCVEKADELLGLI